MGKVNLEEAVNNLKVLTHFSLFRTQGFRDSVKDGLWSVVSDHLCN